MQNSDYYILKNESPEGGPNYREEDFEDQQIDHIESSSSLLDLENDMNSMKFQNVNFDTGSKSLVKIAESQISEKKSFEQKDRVIVC